MKQSNVDLGFIEKIKKSWKLLSHFFPSKIGGKPAWLALHPLPSFDELKCGYCGEPCTFLLQLYSPISENPDAFHRTLFVFICRNPTCCKRNENKNIVVLRSNLARENKFYSVIPPDYHNFDAKIDHPSASSHQSLCSVCGCAGDKRCSKCKIITYCCKTHQTADWKADHKRSCGQNQGDSGRNLNEAVLFKEFELIIEEEAETDDDESDDDDEHEAENKELKEYKKMMKSIAADPSKRKYSVAEMEAFASGKNDKTFLHFKKIVNRDPEQVVRFERGGHPLWITDDVIPKSEDIPKCDNCGSDRQFEFQIMPQLIPHLIEESVEDGIDWGTLVVFTCKQNCDAQECYRKEFIWKQDLLPVKNEQFMPEEQ